MWVWVHGRREGRLCLSIHPLCLAAQWHSEAQGVEEARQTDKWTKPTQAGRSGQSPLVCQMTVVEKKMKSKTV